MLEGLSPKRDSHVLAETFSLEEIIEANRQKPKLADAFKGELKISFIWDLNWRMVSNEKKIRNL